MIEYKIDIWLLHLILVCSTELLKNLVGRGTGRIFCSAICSWTPRSWHTDHKTFVVFQMIGAWDTAPKSFMFSLVIRTSFLLMRQLLVNSWVASGWELVASGTNHVIRGLGFSVPFLSTTPLGRGEGLKVFFIASDQWVDYSWLCNDASEKAPKNKD